MRSRAASDSLAALDSISGDVASNRSGSTSKGVKFQTCTNTLNNFFNNSGNFWVPPSTSSAVTLRTSPVKHTVYLCALHNSHKKQRLFLLKTITGWLSYCRRILRSVNSNCMHNERRKASYLIFGRSVQLHRVCLKHLQGLQLHTSLTELNSQSHRDRHECYKTLQTGSRETNREIIFAHIFRFRPSIEKYVLRSR
jgi:hypothetical protein